MAKRLEITLRRGLAGKNRRHIATVKALGLRRPRQVVMHEDSPMIRGMVRKVGHLLSVRELD